MLWVLAYQVALGLVPPGDWTRLEAVVCVWLGVCAVTRVSPLPLLRRALVVAPFTLAALPLAWTDPARLGLIFLRAWLGLAATLWLVRWLGRDGLLQALERLRWPRLLVATVGLTLRYFDVLRAERERMVTARVCRSAGSPPSWSWRARSTGQLAGALLVRTQARSERVYQAMASRGFAGRPLAVGGGVRLSEVAGMGLALGLLVVCAWL